VNPDEKREWLKCSESAGYFIHTYCQIYDATTCVWRPFHLWPAQASTLYTVINNKLVIILKARQLGMTWLVLAFSLWLALFRPAATILIFSKRDDEAVYLLSLVRLRGMYVRLPDYIKCRETLASSDHEWMLSNGSSVRAFPTTAGDSYTATLAIVDEADLVPDLNRLMNAVKPTIDGGGRMILLSRSNKREPQSTFKAIYRAAKQKENGWAAVFLPWWTRPERDAAWYEQQRRDILTRTASLDDLHQQYPATDTEALAPATLDKRIAADWLTQCYVEQVKSQKLKAKSDSSIPESIVSGLSIPGLVIYAAPLLEHQYVIGADPAEGNPTSDDSAATVLDKKTGEEVAKLKGKFQPSTFAAHLDAIGRFFNQAAILVERNNHGHAVLLWLKDNSHLSRLYGYDGKEGWHSTTKGNALLYDTCADAFRNGETVLHSFDTFNQLASIEGSTLSAPAGEHDDLADSYALALVAAKTSAGQGSFAMSYR
jgi:hypothetical protein